MQAVFMREGCTAADAPKELQTQQQRSGVDVDAPAAALRAGCEGSAAELGAWAEAWRLRKMTALHLLQRAGALMESGEQAAPLYVKWLVTAFTPQVPPAAAAADDADSAIVPGSIKELG